MKMNWVGKQGLVGRLLSVATGLLGIGLFVPTTAASATPTLSALRDLRLINYYPANAAWELMWQHWDAAQIQTDFTRVALLSGNAVRIIIQPSAFGWPMPNPQMQVELAQVISLAQQAALRVQITLFDHWNDFGDTSDSTEWMDAVLAPYANSPVLAFVELQNEVDPTNTQQMAWVKTMLPRLHGMVGSVPVTVSVTSGDSSAPLSELKVQLVNSLPDFWDVHYYGDAQYAENILATDKALAAPRPLFIGETGLSSYEPTDPVEGDALQASYLSAVETACQNLGLPPAAPWMLYDLTPDASPAPLPVNQYYYGLFTTTGTEKPAGSVISHAFRAAALSSQICAWCELLITHAFGWI